jgi:hypothetical protein
LAKLLVFFPFLVLIACGSTFPVREAFVVDVTNQVCVKKEIYDLEELQFRTVAEYPLVPKGPCDRLVGFHRNNVTSVLNFIRRKIKEAQAVELELLQLKEANEQR